MRLYKTGGKKMLEDKLQHILEEEKKAKQELINAQLKADEIKKKGQLEAKRILEKGKQEFLEERIKTLKEIEKRGNQIEEKLLLENKEFISKVWNVYKEKKDSLVRQAVEKVWKELEK